MLNRVLCLVLALIILLAGVVASAKAQAPSTTTPLTPQTKTALQPAPTNPHEELPRDEPTLLKQLVGTWRPVSGLIAGKPMPAGIKNNRLTIHANKTYEFDFGSIKDKGKLVFDLKDQVLRLDFLGTEGPNQDSTVSTIFKLEDEQLVICYRLGSEEKISEFASPENTETFLIRYERVATASGKNRD